MSMTVEPVVAPSVGVVVMSEIEARACVDRIKALTEDVAALLLDLRDRDGWQALGYESWQECIQAEFHMSRSYAHRLINAHLVEQVLTLPIGNVEHLPESHARELVPLLDQPDKMRAALKDAIETSGGKPTAEHVHDATDRQLGRPPRAKTAKPAVSVRRSVSSASDRTDSQDIPDELIVDPPAEPADLIAGDDFADVINNEPYGAAPNAEHWCPDCGGKFRGTSCPCKTTPAPMEGGTEDEHAEGDAADAADGPAAALVSEVALGTAADGAAGDQEEASGEDDDLIADAPSDRSGAAGPSAEADTPTDPTPAPPAVLPPAPPTRTGGVSLGNRPAPVAPPVHQPIRVDGKAPEPVYPTADGFLNGVESHLAGADLDEFARRFGVYYGGVVRGRRMRGEATPSSEPSTDLLAGRTLLEIRDAIRSLPSEDAQVSLLGLLADELPAERLVPLQHRLAVKLRAQGDTVEVVKDLERAASALSPLRRASLANRITEQLELDQAVLVANHANARVRLLQERARQGVGPR